MTLRVLHILNELKPSGAEVMLRAAGRVWQHHGIKAGILSTGSERGPYAAQLHDAGYEIKHLPFKKSSIKFCLTLWQTVRNYDAIHLHTENGNFTIGIIARLAGKPVIRTIHNAFDYRGTLRYLRSLQRKIMSICGVIHASIGPTVYEVELKILSNKTKLVPNWYDAMFFTVPTRAEREKARHELRIPSEAIVLAVVGNCSVIKNHAAVFDAMRRSVDQRLILLHVGTGDDESRERALCVDLHLEGRVRFLGRLQNPRLVLQCADIYVMPSLKEGFSIAALEAIGMGIPCVFSDVHGLTDLKGMFSDSCVWNEPTGSGIAQAIEQMTSQLSHFTLAAHKNMIRCKNEFGVESGVSRYAELYHRLRSA